MDQKSNESPKTKGFFLEENKSKKRFLRGQT